MAQDITVSGTVDVKATGNSTDVFRSATLDWAQDNFTQVHNRTFTVTNGGGVIGVDLGEMTTVYFVYLRANVEVILSLTPTAGAAENIPLRKCIIEDNYINGGVGAGTGYTTIDIADNGADGQGEYIIAGE